MKQLVIILIFNAFYNSDQLFFFLKYQKSFHHKSFLLNTNPFLIFYIHNANNLTIYQRIFHKIYVYKQQKNK